MKVTSQAPDTNTHRFAWDGISFLVPCTWNLSAHDCRRRVSRLLVEDDTAVRLELDWTHPRNPVDLTAVKGHYLKQAKRLTHAAQTATPLPNLPEGWAAFLYTLPGARGIVIAYFFSPESYCFGLLRLHFDGAEDEDAAGVTELIASSFRSQERGLIPWEFYDVAFGLDSRFQLSGTSLQAGRKLMIFEWRLRRLLLWHFSLATVFLKNRRIEDWVVEFLNTSKMVRGPVFSAAHDGSVVGRRARRYPFGHYEEIGRWCFKYHVGFGHCPEKNQVALWVYNYRRPADLEAFKQGFEPITQ